ncbi:uncharacterized protein LTHEOB_8531 [Lasiodiplodia theobromae]|uniref:uncharacterized protein n=1 Tax=Lasiodiplodia theobromae TaxID=45133 RepID=UPI0015C3724C|nr:uncharacterized protein LTHEOB_8531 [Lasiodiplodia theobromae]KAF4541536.1 hypothetical protein LTHEOB_8531 [Lasiodiplodia theobromae]
MASDISSGPDSAAQNLNILGTLIGYLGAEAATIHLFERILWPQRFWNRLSPRNAFLAIFFMPMGGPLHKAALQTLDSFFEHGLFKGGHMGHMLDTAFFQDYKLEYTVWIDGEPIEKEHTRNGLWIRAISELRMPALKNLKQKTEEAETTKAGIVKTEEVECLEAGTVEEPPVRSTTSYSHLVLAYNIKKATNPPVIRNDTGTISPQVYVGVVLSELTGIAVGTIAACIWKSGLATLWFIPLLLKLTSTFAAVAREDLTRPADNTEGETDKCFEIYHRNGVLVIQGKESVVLQFFRHYGHPIRDRGREILQFIIIICLGFVFPVGLVISIMWMPVPMQYLWLGYQLYATLAMHVYRYANGHLWGTTEEAIIAGFNECSRKDLPLSQVILRGQDGTEVVATINTTYCKNLKEAKQKASERLRASKMGSRQYSNSSTTLRSENEHAEGEPGSVSSDREA